MGERQDPGVHFVMVEEKRNILIGCVRFSHMRLAGAEQEMFPTQ